MREQNRVRIPAVEDVLKLKYAPSAYYSYFNSDTLIIEFFDTVLVSNQDYRYQFSLFLTSLIDSIVRNYNAVIFEYNFRNNNETMNAMQQSFKFDSVFLSEARLNFNLPNFWQYQLFLNAFYDSCPEFDFELLVKRHADLGRKYVGYNPYIRLIDLFPSLICGSDAIRDTSSNEYKEVFMLGYEFRAFSEFSCTKVVNACLNISQLPPVISGSDEQTPPFTQMH